MPAVSTEYSAALEQICTETVAPDAPNVDQHGAFPTRSLDALARAGLLGAVSAPEVGGLGLGFRGAAAIVGRLAQDCGSTAMVVCMHYCGTAVIEAHGPRSTRTAAASGSHLSTLAFSEAGSRSHFWAPVGTAKRDGDDVVLDARKSWITSASKATRVRVVVAAAAGRRRPQHALAGAGRNTRGSCSGTVRRPGPARQRLLARLRQRRPSPGGRPCSAKTARASTS